MNMDIDSFCEIMDKILKDNDIAMLIKKPMALEPASPIISLLGVALNQR